MRPLTVKHRNRYFNGGRMTDGEGDRFRIQPKGTSIEAPGPLPAAAQNRAGGGQQDGTLDRSRVGGHAGDKCRRERGSSRPASALPLAQKLARRQAEQARMRPSSAASGGVFRYSMIVGSMPRPAAARGSGATCCIADCDRAYRSSREIRLAVLAGLGRLGVRPGAVWPHNVDGRAISQHRDARHPAP